MKKCNKPFFKKINVCVLYDSDSLRSSSLICKKCMFLHLRRDNEDEFSVEVKGPIYIESMHNIFNFRL